MAGVVAIGDNQVVIYDVYNYQPLSFRMTATAPEPRCESGEFR